MLLVMDTASILRPPGGLHAQMWQLTWHRVSAFLPELRDEIFPAPPPPAASAPAHAPASAPPPPSAPASAPAPPPAPVSAPAEATNEGREATPTEEAVVIEMEEEEEEEKTVEAEAASKTVVEAEAAPVLEEKESGEEGARRDVEAEVTKLMESETPGACANLWASCLHGQEKYRFIISFPVIKDVASLVSEMNES